MTLKATAFDPALDYKVILQDDCTNTANVNVASGSCRLLNFEVDNSGGAAACYLKFYDGRGATTGTSIPNMTFKCLSGDVLKVSLPHGKHFDLLNFWATQNVSPTDNTAPSMSGSNKLSVTLVVEPE